MRSQPNKTEVTRLTPTEKELINEFRNYYQSTTTDVKVVYETVKEPILYEEGKSRVLVIGDIHAPFDLKEYLQHCKDMYETFNCNKVVFIGDLIDNHFASYHETDPEGMGAADELDLAIQHIKGYYEAFPEATVLIGNHDRMAFRKTVTGGLPKKWVRDYQEVLDTPNWDFVLEYVVDDVLYMHGEGGTARTRYKAEEQSVVQGHLHTQAYIDWVFSANDRKFAMQVGTGIDFDAYAFGYAKRGKKPAISCAVVLNGKQPFLLPMDL